MALLKALCWALIFNEISNVEVKMQEVRVLYAL